MTTKADEDRPTTRGVRLSWQTLVVLLAVCGGGTAAGRLMPAGDNQERTAIVHEATQQSKLERAAEREADHDKFSEQLKAINEKLGAISERLAVVEASLTGLRTTVEALPGRRR